jgi:L-arabinose isomerase
VRGPRHLDAHLLARRRCGSTGSSTCASRSAHLHTQFNRDIPWATIDMDFMNLNQAAHGDREHGFIMTACA